MRFSDAFGSLRFLLIIFINTIFNRERFEISESVFNEESAEGSDEWESYWRGRKTEGALLYELIAAFYRKAIIRPALNYFLRKYFSSGASLLHAGCGGGQVDVDICKRYEVTGLDISRNALNMYNKVNRGKSKLLNGSVFKIPAADNQFDGIYNLGVMEHFTVDEIHSIMDEFKRVLKPGGKIVLFWPPEYGISVLFFKMLKCILSPIYGKDVKFHPAEITRLKSKRQLIEIIGNGFQLEEYYFGFRSLATYAICVLSVKVLATDSTDKNLRLHH